MQLSPSQLTDSALKLVNADKLKTNAGMVLNVFAALLAFNVWYNTNLTTKVMNATITANDVWAHYQAKSIKGMICELVGEITDKEELNGKLAAKVEKYEKEKEELFNKGKLLEKERDDAKLRLPWVGYASTIYQLAIVLLSASILTAKPSLFYGSFAAAAFGIVLMCQGLLLLW